MAGVFSITVFNEADKQGSLKKRHEANERIMAHAAETRRFFSHTSKRDGSVDERWQWARARASASLGFSVIA